MTARDLLGFVQMHLAGRRRPGRRLGAQRRVGGGDADAVRSTFPVLTGMGDGWGLGWELFDTDQARRRRPRRRHDRPGGVPAGRARARRRHRAADQRRRRLRPVRRRRRTAAARGSPASTLPARPTPPAEPQRVDAEPLPRSLRRHDLRHQRQPGRRGPALARPGAEGRPRRDRRASPCALELVQPRPETRFIAVEAHHGIHVVFAFLGDDGAGRAPVRPLRPGRLPRRLITRTAPHRTTTAEKERP